MCIYSKITESIKIKIKIHKEMNIHILYLYKSYF